MSGELEAGGGFVVAVLAKNCRGDVGVVESERGRVGIHTPPPGHVASFLLSKGGDHYTRTRGVELVLDRDAATELVRLLIQPLSRWWWCHCFHCHRRGE